MNFTKELQLINSLKVIKILYMEILILEIRLESREYDLLSIQWRVQHDVNNSRVNNNSCVNGR